MTFILYMCTNSTTNCSSATFCCITMRNELPVMCMPLLLYRQYTTSSSNRVYSPFEVVNDSFHLADGLYETLTRGFSALFKM